MTILGNCHLRFYTRCRHLLSELNFLMRRLVVGHDVKLFCQTSLRSTRHLQWTVLISVTGTFKTTPTSILWILLNITRLFVKFMIQNILSFNVQYFCWFVLICAHLCSCVLFFAHLWSFMLICAQLQLFMLVCTH